MNSVSLKGKKLTQWAAVSTVSELSREPPQANLSEIYCVLNQKEYYSLYRELSLSSTCHGISPGRASTPPTILSLPLKKLTPQLH